MKWTDAEDIGIALSEKFPGVDPLTIRFTDLRERVLGLDDLGSSSKEGVKFAAGIQSVLRNSNQLFPLP